LRDRGGQRRRPPNAQHEIIHLPLMGEWGTFRVRCGFSARYDWESAMGDTVFFWGQRLEDIGDQRRMGYRRESSVHQGHLRGNNIVTPTV